MCGIGGVFTSGETLPGLAALRDASSALRHRGPDDEGVAVIGNSPRAGTIRTFSGDDTDARLELPRLEQEHLRGARCVLLQRRLSIIDLSTGGHQPFVAADGRSVLAFNGEIYNYRELRSDLAALGQAFRTDSDTEVLAGALRQWGPAALERLVGMYALAYFDVPAGTLSLARDPFGIKPLYYAGDESGLTFASELRALRRLTPRARTVDRGVALEYLLFARTDHRRETMIEGISQLLPGELAIVTVRRGSVALRTESAADVARANGRGEGGATRTSETSAAGLRSLVRKSVELHMRADVPVGLLLSGGIDSTVLLACMRSIAGSPSEIHAFSYVARGAEISEEPWVDLAARRFGATVHKRTLDMASLFSAERLVALIQDQELPFITPSIIAQSQVYEEVRSGGFKVVLDGQGADELFLGYSRYYSRYIEALARRGDLGRAAVASLQSRGRWMDGALAVARVLPGAPVASAAALMARAEPALVPSPAWIAPLSPTQRLPYSLQRRPWEEEVMHACARWPLPSLLRYADRNAMRVSVENRVPFCTPEILAFARRLTPDQLFAHGLQHKQILREAFRNDIPAEITSRTKLGFEVPRATWVGEALSRLPAGIAAARDLDLFPFPVARLLRHLESGRRRARTADLAWRIFNYCEWVKTLAGRS